MNIFKLSFFFILWTILAPNLTTAQVAVPILNSPVVDMANILGPSEKQKLDFNLRTFYKETKVQAQIFIVNDLQGENIEGLSIRAAEKWKLGNKKEGNGLLLVLAINQRKVRIEVGEGLEGRYTDFHANQIIRKVMAPYFKQKNYFAGLNAFISSSKSLLKKETTSNRSNLVKRRHPKNKKASTFFMIFIFIYFLILPKVRGKGPHGRIIRGAISSIFFMVGGLIFIGTGTIILTFIFLPILGLMIGLLGPNILLQYFLWGRGGFGGGGGFSGGGFSGGGGGWSGGGGGFSGGGSSGSW